MTNKEKSLEIADLFCRGAFREGVFLGAQKMADWKDKQFQKERDKIVAGCHDWLHKRLTQSVQVQYQDHEKNIVQEEYVDRFKFISDFETNLKKFFGK